MSGREPAESGEALLPVPDATTYGAAEGRTQGPGVLKGDFSDFYRGFISTLVGFLLWQGSPVEIAVDLAQETMIKAYRRWDDVEYPKTWARTVASRELVRWFSRTHEEPVGEISEGACSLLPCTDELAAWELNDELLQALRLLPPRQRQVLAWNVDGYEPTEIAEILGIEPAAVRASLMKARRTIAAHIKGWREES